MSDYFDNVEHIDMLTRGFVVSEEEFLIAVRNCFKLTRSALRQVAKTVMLLKEVNPRVRSCSAQVQHALQRVTAAIRLLERENPWLRESYDLSMFGTRVLAELDGLDTAELCIVDTCAMVKKTAEHLDEDVAWIETAYPGLKDACRMVRKSLLHVQEAMDIVATKTPLLKDPCIMFSESLARMLEALDLIEEAAKTGL